MGDVDPVVTSKPVPQGVAHAGEFFWCQSRGHFKKEASAGFAQGAASYRRRGGDNGSRFQFQSYFDAVTARRIGDAGDMRGVVEFGRAAN